MVGKVLQPLESQDPYADDYYFLQYNIKKNMIAREVALKNTTSSTTSSTTSTPPPPLLQIPLPTWKETKERIKNQLEMNRLSYDNQTREWEAKEQVLGHRIRNDIAKPRSLLALPSTTSIYDDEMDEYDDINDDNGDTNMGLEWKTPFTSRLWTTRLAIQQGYEALFTIQELQYMMTSPYIHSNAIAMEEINKEMTIATQLLSQSLGIRMMMITPTITNTNTTSSSSFFDTLSHHPNNTTNTTNTTNTNGTNGGNSNTEFQLDGRHVAAILQTIMGKKLLARGLKFLNPIHR